MTQQAVHFVPDNGTVAQIVYSDDQDRPSQQVVYTADGTSYTSVDTSEHTLVYIHPVEATQANPSQVTYVQQDAETQQVSLDKSDRKDRDLQEDLWFELSSEALCNWMMFVRPAQNHLEQNLVAYQYGHHIYYTTIKNVEPKQELKVWYAASYAEFVNQKIHDVSEEERKDIDYRLVYLENTVLREQEKNWPCYECNRRFMSSEQLQQHLNSHDEKLDFFSRARGRGRGRGKRRFGPGRRPGRPPKFMRLEVTNENGGKCAEESQNAALQHLFIRKSFRPFKCLHCGKAFRDKDKLDQHLRFHGREGNCPLTCDICNKGFINSSALESHMKFHLDQKTYSCIFCPESFDRLDLLKDHVAIHIIDGCFTCPTCKKRFPDFIQRKDKLREHMQRMHNPEREAKKADRISRSKAFKPRIASTDYESFMFKCRLCMMGFRRRGMLTKMVQHIRKKHPEYPQIPTNTIHVPLTTAVISATPAVLTADSTSGETVVTSDLLTQAMTELSQTLTTDYRTTQGDFPRIQYIPVSQSTAGLQQPQHIQLQVVQVAQTQHSTVDVGQLHDPQSYTQHAIQVQHIQVTEPTSATPSSSQVGSQPLSPSQPTQQELSPSQIQTTPSSQNQSQPGSSVQQAYLPNTWNSFRTYRTYQMCSAMLFHFPVKTTYTSSLISELRFD
ncbi:hypothetical protein E2320_007118 [Naja naja]|nr:hypothetical protein E2320_007118 [Naja naja]